MKRGFILASKHRNVLAALRSSTMASELEGTI